MSDASTKRRVAVRRLVEDSQAFLANPTDPGRQEALTASYQSMLEAREGGVFDDRFLLVVAGDLSPFAFNIAKRSGVVGTEKAVEILPHILLNEGPDRPNQSDEVFLAGRLVSLPPITDAMIQMIVQSVRKAEWNGASPGEVGAFLLKHYGQNITTEFR